MKILIALLFTLNLFSTEIDMFSTDFNLDRAEGVPKDNKEFLNCVYEVSVVATRLNIMNVYISTNNYASAKPELAHTFFNLKFAINTCQGSLSEESLSILKEIEGELKELETKFTLLKK